MPRRLRTVPIVLAAVLATLVATALAGPAEAKGHPPKRQAVTMLHKQLAVPHRAASLGNLHATSRARRPTRTRTRRVHCGPAPRSSRRSSPRPAGGGPGCGLLARPARPLPPGRERQGWDEMTDKPFLNDPVGRGQNYGAGWGLVTGRMTAFTRSRRQGLGGRGQRWGVAQTATAARTWRTDNYGSAPASGRCAGDLPGQPLDLGRNRRGEQRLGEPVRRRRLPAAVRVQRLAAGRGHRDERCRRAPDHLDREVRLRRDEPRTLPSRAGRRREARMEAGAAARRAGALPADALTSPT